MKFLFSFFLQFEKKQKPLSVNYHNMNIFFWGYKSGFFFICMNNFFNMETQKQILSMMSVEKKQSNKTEITKKSSKKNSYIQDKNEIN